MRRTTAIPCGSARRGGRAELQPSGAPITSHSLSVLAPFRLDFTASALRRLPSNIVDVITPAGAWLRAVRGPTGEVLTVSAVQRAPDALSVAMEGDGGDSGRALALVRRMLGTDRDVSHFARAAVAIPWLASLVARLQGLKPPRYASLWEALVNAVVFQQVSISAASAVTRRLVMALEQPVESGGVRVYPFPTAAQLLAASDGELRTIGLSTAKVATLRRAAEAVLSGTLDEAELEGHSSPDASLLLQEVKGVGPWTASVVLLRGLGRLDVFPMNDSGVARNLALLAGEERLDITRLLERLRPEQGMLYYHLLLARLAARGELGSPSIPPV